MIKIDWQQFIHNYFWFGWYLDHDIDLRSRISWHQNRLLRRIPVVSRRISLKEYQEKYEKK